MDSLILRLWDSFVGPPAVENIQCSGLNLPALGPSQNLGACVLWTGHLLPATPQTHLAESLLKPRGGKGDDFL